MLWTGRGSASRMLDFPEALGPTNIVNGLSSISILPPMLLKFSIAIFVNILCVFVSDI